MVKVMSANELCYIEVWRDCNAVVGYICFQHDDGKCCFYDSVEYPECMWKVADEECLVYLAMFNLIERWM